MLSLSFLFSFCGCFFPLKGVVPSHCHKVLTHRGLFDRYGLFSEPYSIKHLEVIVVAL